MKLKSFVEHSWFSKSIMILIVLNAILVGIETYPSVYEPHHQVFTLIDYLLLAIFTIEIILKLVAYRGTYFRNGWNLLDFSIVALSLIFISTHFVSVLRIIRVLRVLRTLSAFPSLRRLVNALFLSVPAMGSTLLLMIILFYIYGIIGTSFFGELAPDYFGDFQLSILALFQIFTLEAWASEIFRPIFIEMPWSWLYFVSFILISVFIVSNLFFGELVNNAQKLSQVIDEENDEIEEDLDEVQRELAELKQQNQELHKKLDLITNLLNSNNKEKVS
ncbi:MULTISPECIES: ion transporter [Cytobacillus]|nr:ion transporter [Cytobacillus horneckiae]MEC1158657.1 ion transporter [Cytobacillus horneckiae]